LQHRQCLRGNGIGTVSQVRINVCVSFYCGFGGGVLQLFIFAAGWKKIFLIQRNKK